MRIKSGMLTLIELRIFQEAVAADVRRRITVKNECRRLTAAATLPTNLARVFSLSFPGGEGRGEEVRSLAGPFVGRRNSICRGNPH